MREILILVVSLSFVAYPVPTMLVFMFLIGGL